MSFQILLKIIATNGHRHKGNVKKKEKKRKKKIYFIVSFQVGGSSFERGQSHYKTSFPLGKICYMTIFLGRQKFRLHFSHFHLLEY